MQRLRWTTALRSTGPQELRSPGLVVRRHVACRAKAQRQRISWSFPCGRLFPRLRPFRSHPLRISIFCFPNFSFCQKCPQNTEEQLRTPAYPPEHPPTSGHRKYLAMKKPPILELRRPALRSIGVGGSRITHHASPRFPLSAPRRRVILGRMYRTQDLHVDV